ncbi:MAG: cyclic nucleotide-binding/CBS domain-containing protein [Nitrospirota bacterium]
MIPRTPVKKCMSAKILSVPTSATAHEAARLMAAEGIGCLLVEQGGGFVGIITETDLVRKVLGEGADAAAITAEAIMSFPVTSIDENATLEAAHEAMGAQRIRHLLVTRDGVPVGMISVRSLLDASYDWALQMNKRAA